MVEYSGQRVKCYHWYHLQSQCLGVNTFEEAQLAPQLYCYFDKELGISRFAALEIVNRWNAISNCTYFYWID